MSIITIIGAGNAGVATAAHLKLLGIETVRLYDDSIRAIENIVANGNRLTLAGDIDVTGEARIDAVSTDLARVAPGTDLFVCDVPANRHKDVVAALAPDLSDGRMLWFHPGRTGAVLEAKRILRNMGVHAKVALLESETLLYACRRSGTEAQVFHVKSQLQLAGADPGDLARFNEILGDRLPTKIVPTSLLETSLNNIGMLFHPLPTLMNLDRMPLDASFNYYLDGMTRPVVAILEVMDQERLAVAAAYGVALESAKEWLWDCYEASGDTLYEAIQHNAGYVGIKAPHLADASAGRSLRYISEDVPCGLVPFAELGRKAGVATPAIDAVITLAAAAFGMNFRETGRTLDGLGLANLSVEQIAALGRLA
jgi:opine dehydrogenase